MTSNLTFPSRYEPLSRLGTGGGGEVWAVRDRHTRASLALKVLATDATEDEMAALVREATALSGLEGLGVPRVRQFGRLPESNRPYMLRDLVEGVSLQHLIDDGGSLSLVLTALARAAEQLTLIHRAGFLHGDIKPANIIVEQQGKATLVDLGLAAPWRDAGTAPRGLTPKYAAPELLRGGALTVRAEVYALGAALAESLLLCSVSADRERVRAIALVADRARDARQMERYPSADEFAAALRSAAGLPPQTEVLAPTALWPIVGVDATATRLVAEVMSLAPASMLVVEGESGSGRSVLLRRLAWSLGVAGQPLVWIDESMIQSPAAVRAEIAACRHQPNSFLIVDDAEQLDSSLKGLLEEARQEGARLVVVGSATLKGEPRFCVPPLGEYPALELVKRAIPSLTERLAERLVRLSHGRPGELRQMVERIATTAVVSDEDVELLLSGYHSSARVPGESPLQQAVGLLDRGRYNEARDVLDVLGDSTSLEVVVTRARLEAGLGEGKRAFELLQSVAVEAQARPGSAAARIWALWMGRACVSLGDYQQARTYFAPLISDEDVIGFEAQGYEGLALGLLGDTEAAERTLTEATQRARQAGQHRIAGVVLVSLGVVLQKTDQNERAREIYRQAVLEAEIARDAGTLGTVQLNLAVSLKNNGELAAALEHFEAAVDMGRRSGRRATLRSALLNLANLDLYLGRIARAKASIQALEEQRDQLPLAHEAQFLGLQADLAVCSGDVETAGTRFWATAEAYAALGRGVDAAEARLEGVLAYIKAPNPDLEKLERAIAQATLELGEASAHRPLLHLATARVKWAANDEMRARTCLDLAHQAAQDAQQKDWVWRTLEARAELEAQSGQPLLARRDREEALIALESIAARLPRDLREVFWNDPRRRALRANVESVLGAAPTDHGSSVTLGGAYTHEPLAGDRDRPAAGEGRRTPLEQSLARILEVNRELLGELDLARLTSRVVDYAIELLKAERGFLLLREPEGGLVVHTSRTRHGDDAHAEFSRSIAEQVIRTRQPVVSLDAHRDSRMQGYASVHQLMLETVACVPIESRGGEPLGALYIEAQQRPGRRFGQDVPTLRAFAAQVSLALETTRLLSENQRRAEQLEKANLQLEEARARLKELLGDRTKQLNRARRKLRQAHDTLYSHFGYQGMVGTSAAMRQVYSLMERLKDTDVPVLITGESGTGKEVAARAIHQTSARAKAPLLGVNCGALPEHLLESELFGHVRGAFTGADRERRGLIREAGQGAVLLDEIGEMSAKMQSGLLRVLQERAVRPVGGAHEQPIEARFFFATHRNLEEMVEAGTFREDLFYRIHVVELKLPALRDRIEDVPALADHFLGLFAARYKRERKALSREALRELMGFAWPGNVRQLEHVLLNSWIMSDEAEITVADLGLPVLSATSQRPARKVTKPPSVPPSSARRSPEARASSTISSHRRDERQCIVDALRAANWNRVRAAELVGMPRRTFYRRLRQYKIQ